MNGRSKWKALNALILRTARTSILHSAAKIFYRYQLELDNTLREKE